MSDAMRDRIAAAINDYVVAHFPEVNYSGLADAVIAELGLHLVSPADGWLQWTTDCWKANDE